MVKDIDDYIEMPVGYLKIGMNINFSIYYESYEDGIQLLCRKVYITEGSLRMYTELVEDTDMVLIPKNKAKYFNYDYENRYRYVPDKRRKFRDEYENIQDKAKGMLGEIVETNKINIGITESIAEVVYNQINTVDAYTIIQSISSLKEVDNYLHTHCSNVAMLNGLMGKWLGWDKDRVNRLIKVGLLHDIGKLKVPSSILDKPGKLNEIEFNVIKKHPLYTLNILLESGVDDEELLAGVVMHHEKVNGRGYPYGYSSNKITDMALITSISDVYDAMTAKRVYKEAQSPFEVLDLLDKGGMADLDIDYTRIFVDCMVSELRGKTVNLSNGHKAEIMYIDRKNIEFPVVKTLSCEIIETINSDIKCISLAAIK